jgi:hypothetical protein
MKRILCAAVIGFVATLDACSGEASGGSSRTALSVDADGLSTTDDAGAFADAGGGDAGTEYDAMLTGAQVVPPRTTTATAAARFFLLDDEVTLAYSIDLTAVQDRLAVHLHIGAPGDVTPVTHALTPVGAVMTGQITLGAAESAALASNRMYLDVLTSMYVGGEVRGQIMRRP